MKKNLNLYKEEGVGQQFFLKKSQNKEENQRSK